MGTGAIVGVAADEVAIGGCIVTGGRVALGVQASKAIIRSETSGIRLLFMWQPYPVAATEELFRRPRIASSMGGSVGSRQSGTEYLGDR